ncbi:uncharacterized protein LOC108910416 [Anoplophora glabripennis]|uniref:uncharacterized protein LOC108910416 n=1 Tax=Anoplophora glabripennis TaxID=217634 RepID=UPI0008757440|nr:uncharacterized protein LOC108910416 [Anoplophora glabripennis]
MAVERAFLIFLAIYCSFGQSNGQDCVPSVTSVTIASNSTLFWEVDPDRPCDVTSFTVDIVGDKEDEYHFSVREDFIDVSFLPICERWQFTITPISYDVVGFPHRMTSYIPLPPDTDLALGYFTFNVSGRSVFLAWDLTNQTHGDCSLEYRLTVEDLDQGTMHDVYMEGKSAYIPNVSPCISYQLNLRAINQAHPTIEGPLRRLYILLNPTPQFAPTLRSIDVKATSIDMSWHLEGESNRCPLSSFHIDGGAYFNSTVSLQGSTEPTVASVHIDSLLPNSMYFMTASVENSGGRSPSAPIAVQTIDLSPD